MTSLPHPEPDATPPICVAQTNSQCVARRLGLPLHRHSKTVTRRSSPLSSLNADALLVQLR